ncbi:MAG: hypothetical protein A2015_05935 [Spirochaetes bacterium GWF1_31_7]|nr:MAG: hypothetical protein A2Y30_07775 [Spirochaetes bacterium GWE1_32_154]OHD50797.1 MAG: hypothetical protein A2Y29_02565 [Spirochaetes bacterium GWE2_31_10]OHD52734.1 MAG: hypothetical protein A2015_05935 [Spirochaetes bacterium GWF1_31_7]OHD78544.1 MAG: hypothetical protein A2355_15890 [Spirochaetes bacterium RIFOXYB1_FULL_32_8]HBD95409.1 hypothetical protein [Spirochaetia bacterium]
MFLLVKFINALHVRAIFFIIALFILPILKVNAVSVGFTTIQAPKSNVADQFSSLLNDILLYELTELDGIQYSRVNLLHNDLHSNLKKLNTYPEVKDLDYCISTSIDRFIIKSEPNFYDYEIIENNVRIEGFFYIYSIKNNMITDSKKFSINIISREENSVLEQNALNEIVIIFRKFIKQIELQSNYVEITDQKLFLIQINSGFIQGFKNGDYLRSSDGGLIKLTRVKDDSSSGYVITPSKKDSVQYHKLLKSDFEFKISFGSAFLTKNNTEIIPVPDLLFSLYIPALQFLKPFIDASFIFTVSDNRLLVPIFVSTGVEAFFDIYFITMYHKIGIGALFSPDSDGILMSDSFFFNTFGGISARVSPEIKLFIEGGYRFIVKEKFAATWGYSLSSPSIRGGIGIVF